MQRLIIKRILWSLPTLWVLMTLSFFLIRMAPGGPFDSEKQLPEDIQQRVEAKYRLDQPLQVQYIEFMKSLVSGDLGPSFQYKDYTVKQLIAEGFAVSFQIGIWTLLLSLLAGVALGSLAALYKNQWPDRLLMSFSILGISIPNFVIAPLLILWLSVSLGWLPAGGWNNGNWKHLILPVVALSLPFIASIARLMRTSMIEVLHSDFVRTARAIGLSNIQVLTHHALRPALFPVISYLGPVAAGVITGSVVIEKIFGLPGIGNYFVQGALNRDYTLLQGVILFYGSLIILFNLMVDVIYLFLNPKLRDSSQ